MLGQAWGTEGVSERWYQLAFLFVRSSYIFLLRNQLPYRSPKVWASAARLNGSDRIRAGRRPTTSPHRIWSGRRLSSPSDQPTPLWSTHHLLTERVTHPSFLHTDDYSVSKLTLCWTFLSPTICARARRKLMIEQIIINSSLLSEGNPTILP